ncbi:MAG: flagellar biosynthetic protein FliO [Planctomycetota bacterium]
MSWPTRIRRRPWLAAGLIGVALVAGAGIVCSGPTREEGERVPGLQEFHLPYGDVAVSLGVVIVLIIGLALVIRKVLKLPLAHAGRPRHLRLIEALPLGGRRSIYLVVVHDRALVVGVSEGRMTALGEVADAGFVNSLVDPPDTERSFASHFLSQQEKASTWGGGPP